MPENKAITVYGADWCPDCQRVKVLLGRRQADYNWIDMDQDPAAADKVAELTGRKATPTIVLPDGTVLVNPSDDELATRIDEQIGRPEQPYSDLLIIGAGPSGMAAAIYTTREGMKTSLYEKSLIGGWAGLTDKIENYPGFPDGVAGLELANNMEKQARRFGAEFEVGKEVIDIKEEGRYKRVICSDGSSHLARAVLIATGSDYRRLGIPGEKEYTSRGVHYCATCDGPFYKDKTIAVIGGGNSAMQESVFLTKFAKKILLLVRGSELKGSDVLLEKVKSHPQIEIHYNIESKEITGEGLAQAVVVQDTAASKEVNFDVDGIFVFIGLIPNTKWLEDGPVEVDGRGFVKTDRTFETSMSGVYAAGDVRSGSTLQIASAVGEGVVAALMVREYLHDQG